MSGVVVRREQLFVSVACNRWKWMLSLPNRIKLSSPAVLELEPLLPAKLPLNSFVLVTFAMGKSITYSEVTLGTFLEAAAATVVVVDLKSCRLF